MRDRASRSRVEYRRDDDAVALGLEYARGERGLGLPGDQHGQRPPSLGREVLQLEVLHVDPLGAERLEDSGENPRAVRDVYAEPVQGARVLVCRVEHPAAMRGRLADPARKRARVAGGERSFELLDAAAVLAECGAERRSVVE